MARLARIVVPSLPHHVAARGNRREPIFFEDGDRDLYCDILAEQMRKASVEVWAYCLMPNHVHLILCPADDNALGSAIGAAHRRRANFVNARGRWRGHLSARAEDWPWSSVRAHLAREDNGLVSVRPMLDRIERFADLIASGDDARCETPAFAPPCGPPNRPADRWGPRSSSPTSNACLAAPSRDAHPDANRPPRSPTTETCSKLETGE